MGTAHYPQCPYCERTMVRANVGTREREEGILVCCDPRCHGRAREPERNGQGA